ncbi:MAG: 4-hydroxybenzoate octaprenyltransferase [Gammaproteobacteria bacterium]
MQPPPHNNPLRLAIRKASLYAQLIRFNKPIGTLLLLWPTLSALWIANMGHPGQHLLLVFVLGTFLTRSAGCVINDYADRDIDRFVDRTRNRPLTTGAVTPREALLLMLALLLPACWLVLTTNLLTALLALVGVFLAGVYPYMKRHISIPQFVLGLAFSWGIPMAFAASTGGVSLFAWLIFFANILWVLVYDTIYAMVDREDDIRIGVKSTAILFGDADTTIIGIMQLMFLVALILIGLRLQPGAIYYCGVAVVSLLFVYQQYLIKDRKPGPCLRAFLSNNYVGLTVFLAVFLCYL